MKKYMPFSLIAALILSASSALLAQAPGTGAESGPPIPVRVVAEFLELSEEQVSFWVALREETQPELAMLAREVQVLERRLHEELTDEGVPAPLVGTLLLEIRNRRARAEAIFRARAEEFAAALDEQQRERLFLIGRAAQLQQLLPAFRAVGLIP